MGTIAYRPLRPEDRAWVIALVTERWGSPLVVSRGRVLHLPDLPGLCAELDGVPAGLLTYRIEGDECEVVSLDSLREGRGIGSGLLAAAGAEAAARGCAVMVLITTNDNTRALRFYQRRGWVISAVRLNAIAASRALKPEIPLTGEDGIPIRDEIELRFDLTRP